MSVHKTKLINKFYGGITRDDKSKIVGTAANIEELDIFSNADFIQCEQLFSSYALPATTEAYAFTSDVSDIAYAYGKETGASKVRIMSVASGGSSNPGTFGTLFTSADATNLAYAISPFQYFRTTEANVNYIYFLTYDASTTVTLKRFIIATNAEATVGTLTGLNGTNDRVSMKVIFGELYIMNGQYIAKIDKDGVFTEKAFTLPKEWIAVDIIAVSDIAIILGRYIDRAQNFAKGFWWDLTSITQVDDSFDIPCGGPQWIVNHKETVKICCAINGVARFFQLSGPYAGAAVIELPGMILTSVGTESSGVPVSSPKMVAVKDKILYFCLYKTDKTGVYAIGQIDADKPNALILSKRFSTTDYSLHIPTALMILGSNYFGAYSDNGTATTVICKTLNTPNRSANGIYESIIIDDDNPLSDKSLQHVFVSTKPLAASTDVNCFVGADYGSYTEVLQPSGISHTGTNAVQAGFNTPAYARKKVFQVKLQLVSSTSNSPKVTSLGLEMFIERVPAKK